MKRFVLLFIFIMMICKLTFSTPQVRDILYWNGMTYHVYPFINVENRFDDAQWERLNEKAPFITTGNWRGYLYEFEIRHDSLFLVSIKNDYHEDLKAYVLGSDDRIMMDDYSDTLFLGYGKTFFDEDFPTMIYESEMTVVFKNGVVVYTKDNKNKSRYTELPHNIMKFHEYIYSSIRWEALDKDILAEKPQVYVNYSIDSLGRVFDVTLRKSSGYSDFDNEAMRVIASLPEFSSYFVCGKYLEKKYWQRIVFDTSKRPNADNINGFSKEKNTLQTILLECIEESKSKYENSIAWTQRGHEMYLNPNGLPDQSFNKNKEFYDNLPISTISWGNIKKYKRIFDLLEVSYCLQNDIIVVRIALSTVTRKGRNHLSFEVWFEDVDFYTYYFSCSNKQWERIPTYIYSDVITQSFVCLQNDSISIYYRSPNLDKSSCFYGTYRCSNDTLCLSDNLLNDGMKPDEYLFVLDSNHRTLSVTPYYSTTDEVSTNKKKMMLVRRFKNTSCIKELKKVW